MLKRPGDLERLVDYSVHSLIPPEFAKAVDVLWPKVTSETESKGIRQERFYREVAARIFRLSHPFQLELEAKYAIFFGTSVGLVRSLTPIPTPDQILNRIEQARGYEDYKVKEGIYINWAHVRGCETEAAGEGLPLLEKAMYLVKVRFGKAAGLDSLNKVPVFLEEYFSESSHRRDMMFLAR